MAWLTVLNSVHVVNERAFDPLGAFRRVNTGGTMSLARQALVAGIKSFIFVSAVKVNREATMPGLRFRADDAPAPQDLFCVKA